jgi:hypothetical protein
MATLEELLNAGSQPFAGRSIGANMYDDKAAMGLLNLKMSPNPQAQREAALIEQGLNAPAQLEQSRNAGQVNLLGMLKALDPGIQATMIERLFPGMPKPKIAQEIKGEYDLKEAQAKAKPAMPSNLLQGIGQEGYLDKLEQAVADGSIDNSVALRLQQRHQVAEKDANQFSVDRRSLEEMASTHKVFADVENAFKKTPAFKTGKYSDALKIALGQNKTATSILQFQPIIPSAQLSDEEQTFVAKYNQIFMNLRRMTGDNRFSDQDATFALKAVSDPTVGPSLFPKQLQAAKEIVEQRHDTLLKNLRSTKKNVSSFKELGQPEVEAEARVSVTDGKGNFSLPASQVDAFLSKNKRFRRK